jgi:tetratricopeptide (TPR) repeat protein
MPWLWLSILLAAAFALATLIEPAFQRWSRRKASSQGVVAALLGDSRRLFANHFFVQSDVYLHAGYYPSIFDYEEKSAGQGGTSPALHSGEDEHESDHDHEHGPACQHDFLGKPRNFLDAFGQNFFPSKHVHLGERGVGSTEAREILPWIKFAAEMDPQRPETFTVGAFWLRQINRNDEALAFLREGLRANPDSYEILFELGACYEDKKDDARARNLWELALRRWHEQQGGVEHPDRLALSQILTRLTRLEVRANRRLVAAGYLEQLKKFSPFPQQVQKRIDDVKAGLPFEADTKR